MGPDHVLNQLLCLSHSCKTHQLSLLGDLSAGDFLSKLIVDLLNLRHVYLLHEEVLVEGEHFGAFAATALLDLLVVQEVHLVDVAALDGTRLFQICALDSRGQVVKFGS